MDELFKDFLSKLLKLLTSDFHLQVLVVMERVHLDRCLVLHRQGDLRFLAFNVEASAGLSVVSQIMLGFFHELFEAVFDEDFIEVSTS